MLDIELYSHLTERYYKLIGLKKMKINDIECRSIFDNIMKLYLDDISNLNNEISAVLYTLNNNFSLYMYKHEPLCINIFNNIDNQSFIIKTPLCILINLKMLILAITKDNVITNIILD